MTDPNLTETAAFVTTLRNLASSQNETIFWNAAEFIEGLLDAHNSRVAELLTHNNELLERARAAEHLAAGRLVALLSLAEVSAKIAAELRSRL